MRISEVCIERPVFAWVMTLILVLLGIVGGYRLPLQQYPTMHSPSVTVESNLPGASPEIVETTLTRVVEEALSGIEGIENITSMSNSEDSKVILEFGPERKMEDAVNDIRDRLAKITDKLPQEATQPILTKSRAEDKPVITLALTSSTRSAGDLVDFGKRELEKDIEAVPGVARVDILGAGEFVMRIYLNPLSLSAYNITVSEVLQAIKKQNFDKPAGKLISKDREYSVTTIASLDKPEEFENLAVAHRKDFIVRLRDIGRAEIDADDRKTKTFFNGKYGVSISVVKQSNANPIDVARGVKAFVERMKKNLPEDVTIHVASDTTTFIERSLSEVYRTIFEATLLVVCVVMFFLRSIRSSIIPLVTIPVSLIGALFMMYLLNFSINSLTLMAMVLAIGLVVDDAIVVLENVHRNRENGMSNFAAAFKSIKEISFPVIAMTLTLVAVYAPIALAKGRIGKFLTEFSITLACAVLLSGFAALTLSPMMCARMLDDEHDKKKPEISKNSFWEKFKSKFLSDSWMVNLENEYHALLEKLMPKKHAIAVIAVLIAGLGFLTHRFMPAETIPYEDQGSISISGQAQQSSTVAYTERYVRMLDDIINKIPEVERRVVNITNPTFDGYIQLKPRDQRKRNTEEVAKEIRDALEEITGIQVRVDTGASSAGGGGGGGQIVDIVLRANKSFRELQDMYRNIYFMMYDTGIFTNIMSDIQGDVADYTITLLRDKISSLNVEPEAIADTIDTLIRGRRANTFKKNNKMYEVKVQVENESRQSPEDITNLFIKAGDKNGTLVPLSELVTLDSRSGPVEIRRHNRARSIMLSGFLKQQYSMIDGINVVNEVHKAIAGTDYRIDFINEAKRFLNEGPTMLLVFGLAIAFIYLVMAAQFESWRDPFIIMLSVPLSLTGAVITLTIIDGGSLNMYSNIGFITLIGLITKHGILMVNFANQLRDEDGLSIDEAIVKSCKIRLRPILMTTFAMVLGALPLAMAHGAGSESRRQLGWVIVGGMSIGTIFTLFVIPVFYTYFTRKNRVLVKANAA
jgi:multidrug efflux pump